MCMTYYASIPIIALLIHFIINHDALRKDTGKDSIPAHMKYRSFLIGVAIYYASDAAWGILYLFGYRLRWLLYADTVIYFLAMALTILLWARYVIAYLNEKNRFDIVLTCVGWAFLTYMLIALAVNLFLPVMFRFDADGTYHAGTMRYVTLFSQILLFQLTSVYMLIMTVKQKGKARVHHRTIGLFGLIMTVLAAAQVLWPLLPLYSVGFLLGTCLLHAFVLEDEKEEYRRELERLVQRDKEHKRELGSARTIAYTDSLTGVRNKHAYVEAESRIDQRISDGTQNPFAVVVFDLNGLKDVNDTLGHEAGDRYIKDASEMMCRQFPHSPVFRIGGDEFVAIILSEDYEARERLLKEFDEKIEKNLREGGAVVSGGLDEFDRAHDQSFQMVFARADKKMYERKRILKEMAAQVAESV